MSFPAVKIRRLRPVSGAAFGYDGCYSSEEDLAAVRPPSALFYADPIALPETPAPSRRNTEDDSTTAVVQPFNLRCERVRRLPPPLEPLLLPLAVPVASEEGFLRGRGGDATPPPLGAEMPPVSPFFARIRPSDIDDVRETVRRASITRRTRRRNTLAEQRSTWCSPVSEESFASLRQLAATPVRASMAETLPGWQPSSIRCPETFAVSSDDWLINQEPPMSPLFADENRLAAERRKCVPQRADRWYQVNVHSLFSSPFVTRRPSIAVTELSGLGSKPADPSDPDVKHALRRYPLALAIGAQRSQKQAAPTRIRMPSQRRTSPTDSLLSAPAVSFTVCSNSGSDRAVRAVDVEAMGAAYLPHVHRLLDEPIATPAEEVAGNCLRTPSESSTATLADSVRSESLAEQPKPVARSVLRRLPPRRSDVGITPDTSLPRQQLRASASVVNLRGAFSERTGSLPLTPTPLSAGTRRSTLATRAVPPLLTPAAPATNRHSIMRRNSAMELNVFSHTQPQPPRRMPQQQPLPSLGFYLPTEAPSRLLPSKSYQPLAPTVGLVETPAVQRGSTFTGLRTPTSLSSLTYKAQLHAGSTRGRLQTSSEVVPVSLPPMRSASLDISHTANDTTSRVPPRTPSIIPTPLALRSKQPNNNTPSTVSLFGRRRGTTTTAAVTPTTAPRAFSATSRLLRLARPVPPSSVGNGPRSAPVPVPESLLSSLPPFMPKRPLVGRRPDVRNMFGYAG
ncbi:hypothetical protein GGI20_005517 [Coemansia sp. BCRC 34301]|nr:hypothetical protein GGI20_005517 [Coemansia sp. BCRC 34301]